MTRRWLLGRMAAAAALPAGLNGMFAVRKGYPASAGSGTVATWRWVTLPNSGLQVHLTTAAAGAPSSCRVSWTADGSVTAHWPTGDLTTVPPPPVGNVCTSGAAGTGLTVRSIPS